MTSEGVLSRIGRLIAGITYSAIDKAEGANSAAIVEQAIREIDAAGDDARAEFGKARAEEHRVSSRRSEISQEIAELDAKIRTAMSQGREDLAKAGVAHQIDLEAQVAALDKTLSDIAERIGESKQAMQAIAAARRDAEARLADLKRSEARSGQGESADRRRATPEDGAMRATAAVARVTGVPAGKPPVGPELDELERLHRERAIDERLSRFKSNA